MCEKKFTAHVRLLLFWKCLKNWNFKSVLNWMPASGKWEKICWTEKKLRRVLWFFCYYFYAFIKVIFLRRNGVFRRIWKYEIKIWYYFSHSIVWVWYNDLISTFFPNYKHETIFNSENPKNRISQNSPFI